MGDKPDMAGRDDEPQVRGKSGPDSSTEKEHPPAGGARQESPRVPKAGKQDSGKEGSSEGLH